MPPNMSRFGYQSSQMLRARVKPTTLVNGANVNLKQFGRRWASNYSEQSVMGTIRKSTNQPWRYLGLAGALGLGGMVSYGLSRPANYVGSDTRDMMSTMGCATFAKTVRSRIMKTFGYLSGSLAITGAAGFLLFSRGYGYRVLAIMSSNPIMFSLGTMAATMGCIWMTMGMDYHNNPVGKHLGWAMTSGMVAVSLLGLSTMAGAAIIQQAAVITGCIVGGMSLTAMASPSDTFLQMGPYLGVGLGLVIAASLGGMFFPGSTLLMNISLYGGLGLFGLYTAHDTQRVLHDAQVMERFDPISEQMSLYMDTINIFVRVVQILMMQQRKR